jgi:ribosomal protein S1
MTWEDDLKNVFPDWREESALLRWSEVLGELSVGQAITGKVVARAQFGVWLDIGVSFPALLLVPNMKDAKSRRISFDEYPVLGSQVSGRIVSLGETGEIGLRQDEKLPV